jgi:hypothetical protein
VSGNNQGTLVTSPVRPQGVTDTYPTAYATDLLGGHQQFALLSDRDAIPADRRQEGMTAWVVETNVLYVLSGGTANTNWTPYEAPAAAPTTYTVPFTGLGAGQTVTLPATPTQLSLLFIQGLIESPTNYSVSGSTLTIPPGLLWDGAECWYVFN